MWAWITLLHHYLQYYNLQPTAKIQAYCDNKQVVTQSQQSTTHLRLSDYFHSNYDLFNDTRNKLTQIQSLCNSAIRIQHIHGKNDTSERPHLPDRIQTMLEYADNLAHEAHKFSQQASLSGIHFESVRCALREGEIHCTGNEMTKLRNKWASVQLQTYYSKRWQIQISQYQDLNWDAFAKVNKTLLEHEHRFVIKMLTRWIPVGHQLNKYTSMKHTCPFCAKEEDAYHIYQKKIELSLESYRFSLRRRGRPGLILLFVFLSSF